MTRRRRVHTMSMIRVGSVRASSAHHLVSWSRTTTRAVTAPMTRSGRRGGASGSPVVGRAPSSATTEPTDLVLDLLAGPRDGFEALLGDRLARHLADAVG